MGDLIFVSDLVLHGHHGVFPEETRLGQKFHIDIECRLDLSAVTHGDDYKQAVCYGRLCKIADSVSKAGPYKLIETLGEKIADEILVEYPQIQHVKVRVRKPTAPIAETVHHVGVEISRQRQQTFAISLGSNMGHKASNLTTALTMLALEDGINIDRTSRFYRTKPWGNAGQDWFMNACAVGTTTLSSAQLLRTCKALELRLGRTPGERWGPRVIDIDLLTFGDVEISRPELVLPHPEMLDRIFVLKPLAEIAPELVVSGMKIEQALLQLEKAQNSDDLIAVDE